MAYIGSSAAVTPVAFSGVNAQSFNGDGSTVAFTLNRPVSSVAAIEVVVNNVQQSPYDGSYSVSNTTLTFSAAPSTGTGNIYVVYRDFPVGSITDPNAVAKTGDTMTGNLIVNANVGIGTSSHYDASTKLTVAGRINTSNGVAIGSMNYGGGAVVNIGSLSDHPVQLMTNNTTRVVVDSAGRVTMPYQPAFNGTNSSVIAMTNSTWSVVAVDTIRFDRGNNFNTSTYRFTAPVTGVYQVNTSVQTENNSSITWMYFYPVLNGTTSATNGVNFADFTPTGTYWHHNHSCLISMAAGDYVQWKYIKSGGSADLKSTTENSYSIYLVG